jgi:hypothetical protein
VVLEGEAVRVLREGPVPRAAVEAALRPPGA